MNKILFSLLVSLFLISCQNLSHQTNIGPYAKSQVQRSMRSSVVDEYTNNEVWKLNGKNLGVVETEFCQKIKRSEGNGNVPFPSDKSLHNALKVETQKRGGNAIVYDSCTSGDYYMGCDKYKKCRATAFLIDY